MAINYDFRYLSPEERNAYQQELLRLLETRNESLCKKWGISRAERCSDLKLVLGDFSGPSGASLKEGMEHEFYLAGRELLDLISRARREVQA